MSKLLIPKIETEKKIKDDILKDETKIEILKAPVILLFGVEIDSLSFYLYTGSVIFLTIFLYIIGFFKEMKNDFKLLIIFTIIAGIFILNIFTSPTYSFNYQLEYSKLTDIQQQLLVLTGNLIIYIFVSIYLLKSSPFTNTILFTTLIIAMASIFSMSVLTEGIQTRTLRKIKQNNLNICICLLIICFYFQLKNYI